MPALMQRLGTMVVASAHDFIDIFDSPERNARQALRRLQQQRLQCKHRVVEALAAEKQLGFRQQQHREQCARLQAQAREALEQKDEATALDILKDRAHHEQAVVTLQPAHIKAQTLSHNLMAQMKAIEILLREAEQRQLILTQRRKGLDAQVMVNDMQGALSGFSGVGQDLLHMQSQLDAMEEELCQAEFQLQAMAEVDAAIAEQGRDDTTETTQQRAEAMLQAMKQ